MKTTKIIKDQKQTRTTIPASMVKEAKVETGHVAHWKLQEGKLSADVMSHKEFMKAAKSDSEVPAQTHNALSEESQSKSDIAAIKRRDAVMEDSE